MLERKGMTQIQVGGMWQQTLRKGHPESAALPTSWRDASCVMLLHGWANHMCNCDACPKS